MEQLTTTLQIAVLDRGFVYVGACHIQHGTLTITNAQNVRRWGTQNGLGELAMRGPQANTKLDAAGTVTAPLTALSHLIDCDTGAWPNAARAA